MIPGDVGEEPAGSRAAATADAPPATKAATRTSKTMGDKNPKTKRKLQVQQQQTKQHKTEEFLRSQQRLHEIHDLKHPHEPKG
jgi:hypothetical protein